MEKTEIPPTPLSKGGIFVYLGDLFLRLTFFIPMLLFNHMVKYQTETLDSTFAALADPTRRAILTRLSFGDSSVTALAAPFDVSLPAISKQLRVLERAGLLVQEKDGRVRRCKLEARPMKEAVDWIAQYRRFWEDKLDSLASYLEDLTPSGSEQETEDQEGGQP